MCPHWTRWAYKSQDFCCKRLTTVWTCGVTLLSPHKVWPAQTGGAGRWRRLTLTTPRDEPNWCGPDIFLDCILFMFAVRDAPLTIVTVIRVQYHCCVWGICFHQTLINLVSDYVLHGQITLRDSRLHNRVAICSSMMINGPNKKMPSRLSSDNRDAIGSLRCRRKHEACPIYHRFCSQSQSVFPYLPQTGVGAFNAVYICC